MDSKSKVSQVLNNNSQVSRLRGRPRHRWWNCVQIYINKCKITSWEDMSKTELTERSPLRRKRSVLDCSAIEGEVGYTRLTGPAVTDGKEMAETTGNHIGKITSLGRSRHSKLISIHDRHRGKAYRITVIVTLFFLNNLQI